MTVSRKDAILDIAAEVFARSGIRAPLDEIAARSGIKTGSLYYHFESKDALVAALLQRLREEFEKLAASAEDVADSDSAANPRERLAGFARAIAATARRHRAALMLTYIKPPQESEPPLRQMAEQVPTAITRAVTGLLEQGQAAGEIRAGLDLPLIATLICQNMLQTAVSAHPSGAERLRLPELKCQTILDGTVARGVRSAITAGAAHRAVDDLAQTWQDTRDEPTSDRRRHIERAARAVFARRGVALTTMRDVAAAARIDIRVLYRVFDSKDQLVASILEPYLAAFDTGWQRVMTASAQPVETLDALLWLVVSLHDRFRQEQRIAELAIQQAPPSGARGDTRLDRRLTMLRAVLRTADTAGMLRLPHDYGIPLRASAFYSSLFPPANLIAVPLDERLSAARDTVIQGISAR